MSLGHDLHSSAPHGNAEAHRLRRGIAGDAGLLFQAEFAVLAVAQLAGGWIELHGHILVLLEGGGGLLAVVLIARMGDHVAITEETVDSLILGI